MRKFREMGGRERERERKGERTYKYIKRGLGQGRKRSKFMKVQDCISVINCLLIEHFEYM